MGITDQVRNTLRRTMFKLVSILLVVFLNTATTQGACGDKKGPVPMCAYYKARHPDWCENDEVLMRDCKGTCGLCPAEEKTEKPATSTKTGDKCKEEDLCKKYVKDDCTKKEYESLKLNDNCKCTCEDKCKEEDLCKKYVKDDCTKKEYESLKLNDNCKCTCEGKTK